MTRIELDTHRNAEGNEASYWSDDAVARTEFLAARYTDFAFPPHFHETHAIGIIETGGQRFSQAGRSSTVMPAGRLCVINPGMIHEGRAAGPGGWRYRMIYPNRDVITAALAGEDLSKADAAFGANIIDDPELFCSFYDLHTASQRRESVLERESRILLFLARLFTRHAGLRQKRRTGSLGRRSVDGLREYLHANWNSDIRTSDLATLLHCSQTHAVRAFSREIGLPPHRYLLALRVERVKEMIRNGLTLAACASQAGFYDQSQMTRHFKSFTGLTPGSYLQGLS
ncbi:AraC family transcriptional regulator [Mesorhizobium sp.]|uniref:AraC family transcriptional regulator n=1 Tax=Mesorhizobium sp. TaxID=1871066 RepID=UPI0025DEDA71|nr:AraC family transcriptional regulator [Mesorhizobium sp.]